MSRTPERYELDSDKVALEVEAATILNTAIQTAVAGLHDEAARRMALGDVQAAQLLGQLSSSLAVLDPDKPLTREQRGNARKLCA